MVEKKVLVHNYFFCLIIQIGSEFWNSLWYLPSFIFQIHCDTLATGHARCMIHVAADSFEIRNSLYTFRNFRNSLYSFRNFRKKSLYTFRNFRKSLNTFRNFGSQCSSTSYFICFFFLTFLDSSVTDESCRRNARLTHI